MDSQSNFDESNVEHGLKGMSLREVATSYGNRESKWLFGIKGYKFPDQPEKEPFSSKNILKFIKPNPKRTKSYLTDIVNRSKAIPDPTKYSKIIKWSEKKDNKGKFS